MYNFKKSVKTKAAMVASMVVLMGGIHKAAAGSQTSNMQVSASVVASCTIAANPMKFGQYALLQLQMQSSISVTCTNGAPYDIGLDAGTGNGAAVDNRLMTSGAADTLSYSLTQDVDGVTNWGNTIGMDTVRGIGTGVEQLLTVYGTVKADQPSPVGDYADVIVATVTFQ